jgi:hypothetical protein
MAEIKRNKSATKETKKFCSPYEDIPTWVLLTGIAVLLFLVFWG